MKHPRITLAIVPAPSPSSGSFRGVVRRTQEPVHTGPLMTGPDSYDLICGNCLLPLATGVEPGALDDVIFECPGCHVHGQVEKRDAPRAPEAAAESH